MIAACIPFLQPLVEMVKIRAEWVGKSLLSNRKYKEYFSKSASQPGVELRSKPRKKLGTHGFAMRSRDNSKESVNELDTPSAMTSSDRRNMSIPPADGILKTNTISITYDQNDGGPSSADTRWAPV